MKLETEITINATVDKVWNHLINFEQYPNWNSFIKSIHGNPSAGESLIVKIQTPESNVMTFKPRVLKSEKNKEFRWLGHLGFSGLFDGEHYFLLKDNGNGTTQFIHGETFKGILVPLFKKMLKTKTIRGFAAMNAELKAQVE